METTAQFQLETSKAILAELAKMNETAKFQAETIRMLGHAIRELIKAQNGYTEAVGGTSKTDLVAPKE